MINSKRFYVFTGKGGVGKTTLSLSFAKYLQSQGKKVLFAALEPSPYLEIYKELSIEFFLLNLLDSTKIYLSKKLKSAVIATWILNTPFFKAMLNIVPGFSYLIFLGHLVDYLRKDPELIVVMDSPSSGYVQTMFESLETYKDIFKTGILVEDIVTMIQYIYQKEFLKVNICTIPTMMSMQEALELKEKLSNLNLEHQIDIYANNSLIANPLINEASELPTFLNKKKELEKEVLIQFQDKIKASLPHLTSLEYAQIVKDLAPYMAPFL